MKRLWMLFLLMAVTLLVAGAVACGGDDDDGGDSGGPDATVDAGDDGGADDTGDDDAGNDGDYYNQLESIFDEADQQTADIAEQYGGPYDDAADEVDQTVSAFDETVTVFLSVIASMDELEPPADAEDAHSTYRSNLASAVELFGVVSDDFAEASTGEELTALQNQYGETLTTASGDIESNCVVLQDLADSAGSGADLGCSVQD